MQLLDWIHGLEIQGSIFLGYYMRRVKTIFTAVKIFTELDSICPN